LAALQESLGVSFNDLSQLRQALIHSSYVNENPGLALAANERLEFLGDAVLELVVTEKLYQNLPEATEGELTKLRAALVSRDTLARLARVTGLGDYLYLGKGEEASGGRDKPANLANVLEAVIAAVFLDQNLPAAKNFILSLFQPELEKVTTQGGIVNHKTQLQELVQAQGQPLPVYYLIETRGPDHEPQFSVEVRSGDTVLGQGAGKSKKLAEAEAARSALGSLSK
jgi:ribonuclease-3